MTTLLEPSTSNLHPMKKLSPLRHDSRADTLPELVDEQMQHFGLNPNDAYGATLRSLIHKMYESQSDAQQLWDLAMDTMVTLPHSDRIQRWNSIRFLAFQVSKILDTLMTPARKAYQNLGTSSSTKMVQGAYPLFDNVTALFSATPVIARTATYLYASSAWISDAFKGQELMLEMYSRMLNPTSVCLANHIVDLEAGEYAGEYFAWNFNSGMAAIDAVLSHVLGRDDIVITSRNIYGGAYQLIHQWYAKGGNLEVAVETFDGYSVESFWKCLEMVRDKYRERIAEGRRIYLYMESPCNPHGYVLDVANICKKAHEYGVTVMLDSTVGTPFLCQPLQRKDSKERPDYVIHSYTKDLSGCGGAIAGCVIARNEDMFIPKGESFNGRSWEETMFWNVYYVKGAFLNADAAFEVMQGMRTLPMRVLQKSISTKILATFLKSHPAINVHCNAIEGDPNFEYRERYMYGQLPAPLFTMDMGKLPREVFQRFFDSLSPVFGHMISLGQPNTIVSCPSLTTHSELDDKALEAAGMSPTTVRFAVGDENIGDLIRHIVFTAKSTIDPEIAGFSKGFMSETEARKLIEETYVECHKTHINAQLERDDGKWY